jgi:transcriptional regulator with XRE-family HTH domain
VNAKKVRELSGLTQERVARALDLTLNGWQRKEQFNTQIKVELRITEQMMAELLLRAHKSKTTVSELISQMIRTDSKNL